MFCFIKGSERDGLGKFLGVEGGLAIVEYFDSPSVDGRRRTSVPTSHVARKKLGRNTRVHTFDELNNEWRIGRVREDDGEGVEVRLADKVDAYLYSDRTLLTSKPKGLCRVSLRLCLHEQILQLASRHLTNPTIAGT